MEDLVNLDDFPLHQPDSPAYRKLVIRCRQNLNDNGMFSLENFVPEPIARQCVENLRNDMDHHSFVHQRRHNIYFKKQVEGLESDHPALVEFETSNRTLCGDQLASNKITQIYQWQPLINFIALCMDKSELFIMKDPLARLNVMSYHDGKALNWHFDRSEFTTTLLLQKPEHGGVFEFRTDLRSPDNPNYSGVAKLLAGDDPKVQRLELSTGTLNVFKGVNTPHRVTPVHGARDRLIAVFSYYEKPDVIFSDEERIGFYGRSG